MPERGVAEAGAGGGAPAAGGAPQTRRQVLVAVLFVACAFAFLYFVLPKITGLRDSWDRLDRGDPWWLIVAGLLELASFGGYVALFRTVCVSGAEEHRRIDWRVSYQITMAGLAATRLFAAAGAGGIALTAWALRRPRPRTAAWPR
ncbi:MAG TPA: hypothetical protein PK838_09110, partial [Thermoleophilia bacterium]|nr:hypothetical protein [Thermoleophilia bacterium]